jgi:hypothetical protein
VPRIYHNDKFGRVKEFTHIVNSKVELTLNRQFQLLVYACMGGWEVRDHTADYVEKV